MSDSKRVLLWGRRAREIKDLGRLGKKYYYRRKCCLVGRKGGVYVP